MAKELFVSSTPHETKVAIVEDDQLAEIYYERENEYTLAGSIYKGRVTRVLPGMQSAFVNIGLERDAFLYVSDFLLEEEEEVEGLDAVVARSRPEISEPQSQEPESESQSLAQSQSKDRQPAAELASAAEAVQEDEHSEEAPEATEGGESQEEDREGARKWRGRRRRRGRGGRFPEREQRESQSAPAEPRSSAAEPRSSAPASGYEPMLLPGESISKYQPHSAAATAVETPSQSAPRQPRMKPSTEYSIDSAQVMPGSMTLPGESIAKYRHEPIEERHIEEQNAKVSEEAPAEPREHGVPQDPESAGPIPHHVQIEESQSRDESEVSFEPPAAEARSEAARPEAVEDESRFESMNVAGVFGGDEVEQETAETEHSARPSDDVAGSGASTAEAAEVPVQEQQPWQAAGSGVVEEEEIEEEESELPGFEEEFEPADYDELEEEVLGGSDLAGQLTEAVRDAHVDEHAIGRYEPEGVEADEDGESPADVYGLAEEDELDTAEEDQHPSEEAEPEEMEGARAEHRSGAGTAPYQQQRQERRPPDRRGGRRPGRRMRGRPRHFSQRQLPAISDLLKEGQEILVQIAKEPIAKKGARITSHIALPGRYLVYMPTVHHTGVSRKIASEEERHRLKRIVLSERGDAHGGFIVRTAAAGANEEDLRADIRFLINLWTEIRGRADKSKAPALIYHDLNLVERILRDQVTTTFSQIWADTEQEYERILRFVSRFQPSLVKRVKLYSKETPLFEQFNITDEINKALKSKVWLKSGGYIVINQTEALVAIDINTGKYVGKTARLEDTIVKTNIDAIKEIVRQIRLRDLGGIIVIDFIDMDERKNRQRVMQALEEALKADRAPSKVLQFNDFGLVAITRKRVKQSLERTLGQPCPTCQATGMIKSVSTVCNEIYVEMRKMSRHFEHDIMLRVHPDVGKALKGNSARWLQEMEELTKRTILVKSDPLLHPEQFDIQ